MTRLIFVLQIFLTLAASSASAQYFSYGEDPASLRWRQIRTSHFQLIYPQEWEKMAPAVAEFLETIRQPLVSSLQSHTRPIPVILRNQTMLSNGFVTWAPKRIELFTTTPYDNQATNWMRYLSIHEFRHVAQIEAINRSTTRFFSFIFGQHITGAVAGLHLPLWFLEGDAVLIETAMTKSGRGRLPSFHNLIRSQILERGIFSFDKAILGSYRDRVPNHYVLGYHLVSKTRDQFGMKPFVRAFKNVANTPFLPGSFSRGIRRETGMNLRQLYQHNMTRLMEQWKNQLNTMTSNAHSLIEPDNNLDYVNYINPQYIDDDNIIAIRTAMADIPRLVKINRNGSEKILYSPTFGEYSTMSYSKGLSAWIEYSFDPRWAYRVWSNIRVFDLTTLESWKITRRGRFQSPRLSPDGSKIAAIELDELSQWMLVIIDSRTGNRLQEISDTAVSFISQPEWSSCATAIIAIATNYGSGKSIVRFNLDSSEAERLFSAGFYEISKPVIHDNLVYFTGTWSGHDELYAWDIDKQHLYHVLASAYGASNINISDDGTKMLFSDFHYGGQRIGESTTITRTHVNADTITNISLRLYYKTALAEGFIADTVQTRTPEYTTEKYSRTHNTLHFHSWAPVALDIDGMEANPGFTLLSQDLLGTTSILAGFEFDPINEGRTAFADLTLRSQYPVLMLRGEAGVGNRYYRGLELDYISLATAYGKITASMFVPLVFTHRQWIWGLTPRLSTSHEWASKEMYGEIRDYQIHSMSYSGFIYALQRMAFRDLYPRWGFVGMVYATHSPFKSTRKQSLDSGHLMSGEAMFYLPGLLAHHSLRLYGGFQNRASRQLSFANAVRFARGYRIHPSHRLQTFTADYSFPLFYPDFSIGSLAYIKRLKSNLFADYSIITPSFNHSNRFSSAGIDLIADLHLFRMPMPFEAGIRLSYTFNDRVFNYSLLVGVNFDTLGRFAASAARGLPLLRTAY